MHMTWSDESRQVFLGIKEAIPEARGRPLSFRPIAPLIHRRCSRAAAMIPPYERKMLLISTHTESPFNLLYRDDILQMLKPTLYDISTHQHALTTAIYGISQKRERGGRVEGARVFDFTG